MGASGMSDKEQEGWGVMRPGDRVYHYYVSMEALCGRVMFYRGDVTQDTGNTERSKEDCSRCFKALVKRRKA